MNNSCWYKSACTIENCNEDCIRYLEMKYLMDNSNIPVNRQFPISLYPDNIDYDKFVRLSEIKETIVDFVNKGNNLYIGSKYTGNGKTSWAIKIMLRYFNEIWAGNGFKVRGIFIHIPTFLSKIKQFNAKDERFNEILKNIVDVDLVIWDDIASTGLSSYDHSQLLTYIDQRILNGKSNIYTGNIDTLQEMQDCIGQRLASRVYNGSEIIILNGKDRRKTN